MSRCYPFPPPGYVRDESVIESIKGAKEEVKRDKKDRKHKKDKKRKERDNEADGSKKHRLHKRRRKEEEGVLVATKKVDDDVGRGLIKSEVEKSCLTEELELQTSSQTSCDSTLRSNERAKQIRSQPLDCRHNDSDPEVMMVTNKKDQKHRSSRERLNPSQAAPSESVSHPYPASANEASRDASRVSQEKRRDSNSGSRETATELSKEKKTIPLEDNRDISRQFVEEKPSSSHQETVGPSKLCRKCPPSTAVRFLNLIENWSPDLVESKLTTGPEDQEWWLFMKVGAKRHHQVSNQTTTSKGSSSTMWPTARFLPGVELHALPFTVPF